MAWDDEMVAIVRGLVQDYANTTTGTAAKYTDDTLSTVILIGGLNLQGQVNLPVHYTISVSDVTLSPDPTGPVTRDDVFVNLASLKAACILINAEIRQYTGQGISIRDGSSAISLQRNGQGLALMRQAYCTEYEKAVYQYQINGVMDSYGEAIVGPIKAWYWGGGPSADPGYGIYPGPLRIGRGAGTVGAGDWFNGGGLGPASDAGGNWGL